MAHSYPMDGDPDAAPETDPVLRPYSELEDHRSLYVAGLAVIEGLRGQGLGTRLMAAIAERARRLDRPRISLICFERNEAAMRLYRRLGYRELARRPIVPHPALRHGEGDAVLLARELR
jgi:ribosomal protein S18 acetylase RimI-like enzyme